MKIVSVFHEIAVFCIYTKGWYSKQRDTEGETVSDDRCDGVLENYIQ